MADLTRKQEEMVLEIVRVLGLPEPDVTPWSQETLSRFLQFTWTHMPLMKNSRNVQREVAYLKKNGIKVKLSKFRNLAELERWADDAFWHEIIFPGQNPPWPFIPNARGSYREAAWQFDEDRFGRICEVCLARQYRFSIIGMAWENVRELKEVVIKFFRRD